MRHKLCVIERKMCFYIVLYPVRWTAQIALHFTPGRPVHSDSDTNSAFPGSILARKQLCTKTIRSHFTIARYSCIQFCELGCRGENKNGQTSKDNALVKELPF